MNDTVQVRTSHPLTMQWSSVEASEPALGGLGWWLGGGGMLLAWTAIALLLTSA